MVFPVLGRHLVAPVGLVILGITALSWYVTFAASGSFMALATSTIGPLGPIGAVLFFALMTTMMVAMMLPATLPMVSSYRQMLKTRGASSGGTPVNLGTTAFMVPYLLLWGGFGVLALLGLSTLGLMGRMVGPEALVPGFVLIAAGAYQITSIKQACLRQCRSPLTFMLGRWRNGVIGAFRMGLSHSLFCLGCCWLFMIALFVTGAMSLVWMGGVSLMIFVEKVGVKTSQVSRGIGLILVILGMFVSYQGYSML